MNNKFILILTALFITTAFSSCRIAVDRPILTVPDGNQDRMKKEDFSGTDKDPKYWIYKVTVVKTSFSDSRPFVFEGLQSSAKAGYFEFTREKLKFNNIVTRRSLESSDIASQGAPDLINEWSINHSEFRLTEIDGYTTNREEENNYISWNKKQWFTIDWSKADISEAGTFPYSTALAQHIKCYKKKTAYVLDPSRKITADYITFTVAVEYEQDPVCASNKSWMQTDFVTTVHYKYSFKAIPDPRLPSEDYTPYVYDGEHDPLLQKYGFFRVVRPAIAEDRRDKNLFYMSRWNPNKKHTFHFSKAYPEEYKNIAHGVICHTNKLFARHKLNNYPLDGKCTDDGSVIASKKETCTTGICFELRENTGQELGDIRYSFFHLLQTNIPVLGYGPSDQHPATGETIAGNVIVSVHLLDFYLKYILQDRWKRDLTEYYDEDGNLTKNQDFKYENSSLFQKMKQTLKENDHTKWTDTAGLIDKDSDIRPEFEYLVSQMTFAHPASSSFTNAKEASVGVDKMSFAGEFEETFFSQSLPQHIMEEGRQTFETVKKETTKELSHERNTVLYPAEPVIAQLPAMLANGMTPEEIKQRILFNLMAHEFGHVLNLRHNFYGSVDARHYHRDKDGNPLLHTSSVMDYMNFKNKAKGPLKALFGPYDTAALVYAYSNGKIDLSKEQNTQYLFCTDHHKPLNSLCNHWDRGTTPSEVTMSLIENYEESYFIRNLRLDRAYWDTSYYPSWVLRTLWDIKRPLMMWRTAFRDNYIKEALTLSVTSYTEDEKDLISFQVQKDIRQAVKLSMAFYNSVLQLSTSDRDWKTFYNEESGSIEKIGISWDKIFSMFFLMGDMGFLYNPNHYLGKASYLHYINKAGFRQMMEEIMENTLTVRVDMEPWFIGFGRSLYAQNASNHYNISDNKIGGVLLEKIGIRCYTPKGLKDRFGIDPNNYKVNEDSPPNFLDTALIPMKPYLSDITDSYYRDTNEILGVTHFDGNYYVASSHLNKFSFTIIDNMRRATHSNEDNLRLAKQDVYDVFYLYNLFKKNGVIPQTCDNGD